MRPRLNLRAILLFSFALSLFFVAEFVTDWLWAGGAPGVVGSVDWTYNHLANLTRSLNVLLQLVIIAIALAIPLTSNIYTPRFIDVFLKDRVNQFVLTFYLVGMANGIFVSYWTRDGFVPQTALILLEAQFVIGVAILLPYYYYMFRNLEPSNITAVLADRAERYLERVARSGTGSPHQKEELLERIRHLGNIILRSLDRSDRDVALEAVGAIHRVLRHYLLLKRRLPAGWFLPERRHFPALSDPAFQFLEDDGTWVERAALHQLELAYNASLARVPDVVSGIAHTVQEIACEANREGDQKVLKLSIRYLNTFTREAMKCGELRSIYDTLEHYERLARELLGPCPDLVVEIARYFVYYGELARATGVPFVFELVGYDLSKVVEWAYTLNARHRSDLLGAFLSLDTGDAGKSGLRLNKARILLAAFFREQNLEFELEHVMERLSGLPGELVFRIEKEFAEAEDPQFWEVNNRQQNLDYVPPDRLVHVQAVLSALRGGKGPLPELKESDV